MHVSNVNAPLDHGTGQAENQLIIIAFTTQKVLCPYMSMCAYKIKYSIYIIKYKFV